LQAQAEEAKAAMLAKQVELDQATQSGGSVENCEKRLKFINKALEEVEFMKSQKSFLGKLFGK
jgi:hypothetical protein